MDADRIWLDVPYSEKDEAKALGARWDPDRRRWYAPPGAMASLSRWAAGADLGDVLPGEDRRFGSGLFVDLVPSSCWFTNARSCIAPKDWERVRRMVTERANRRCEVCDRGADPRRRRRLEVHERWHYDNRTRTQTLKRLICLCNECHQATHFGLAGIRGKAGEAMAHLLVVTKMPAAEAQRHIDDAFALWRERSRFNWILDLSVLVDAGVDVATPESVSARRVQAEDALLVAQENDRLDAAVDSPDVGPASAPRSVQATPPAASAGRWFRRFIRG